MANQQLGICLSVCLYGRCQSGPWRKPRAPHSFRAATPPPIAPCTPTQRAAPCQPSTAAPTPVLSLSQRSCLPGRSNEWSPASVPSPSLYTPPPYPIRLQYPSPLSLLPTPCLNPPGPGVGGTPMRKMARDPEASCPSTPPSPRPRPPNSSQQR